MIPNIISVLLWLILRAHENKLEYRGNPFSLLEKNPFMTGEKEQTGNHYMYSFVIYRLQ